MKICNKILQIGLLSAALGSLFGCSVAGRLQRQQATARLAQLTRAERQERQQDSRPQVVKLQRDSNTLFLAPVDTLADGERVMSFQIEQVTVVAKMRSIPERNGRVVLDFIVTLPKELLGKSRSVVITPVLHKPDESVPLEDLVIRGGRFSLLQERDYWQYETYVERFRPDTVGREAAFNRFVKFPYPEDVRLDSLVEGRSTVTYYYSQAVKTDETSKKMLVTLQGQVLAVDDSALGSPTKHPLHHDGGNGVDDKLVAIVLGFQIAVGSTRTDELAVLHGLPLLRPDLAPNVQSVGFVYHVPQRDDDTGMGVLRGGGVEVFVDRNKADTADAEILLDVIAGVNGVSAQTGEVFHNDAVDVTGLNIREHLLKARTVEVCPGRTVVDIGIVHADLRVLLQIAGNNHLLGFNGYAVRVGILHRKADIDRGAASGVGLLHGHRSRFFSAFPCHAHPTFLCS